MIVPSRSLRQTLPVNPSQTTTSPALRRRCAALDVAAEAEVALGEQRVRLERELVALLRLLADREQPHLGLAISSISWAKIEPIWANWSRCSARASAFAPESSRTEGPSRAGITTAIAGRSTSGRRRMWKSPAASVAPVFPAETTASASPAPTARHARTSELCGFARTASTGFSCISIVSVASTSSRPVRVEPLRPVEHRHDGVDAASSAPATISSGPCRRPWHRRRRERARSRTTEPEFGAARPRARDTSCRSGTRDAAASAGGRRGTR